MNRTVDDLLGDLAEAKRAEEAAKKKRLACEEQLLTLIADKPEKGRAKLGDAIRCTVEFKLSYKADVEAIRQINAEDLPVKRVEASYEFDEKAYEALRTSNPTLFARVREWVTTKPSKPSFELKL